MTTLQLLTAECACTPGHGIYTSKTTVNVILKISIKWEV